MKYSTYISNEWISDGDTSASIIRISDTKLADTNYLLSNPLGREPVGVQIIMANKPVNIYVINKDASKIVVKFDAANCDVNIRIW